MATLSVREGAAVDAGAALFSLDTERAAASYAAAEAQSEADRVRAFDSAIAAARANAVLAQSNYERTRALFERDLVARVRLDQDRAALDAARADVRRAQAERASVSHDDAAAAAQADLARTQLRDRAVVAPVAGRVERIFRRPGEFVQPGDPVLALLPPANLKVRFYAPQAMLSRMEVGRVVRVACDGCAAGMTARISFVASEPQFTPPVIYSTEERAKLVYLVEARLEGGATLRPGQPLDVTVDPS